jgi:pimeloyl-ACP methyl ester carboxylesterase
VVRSLPDGSTGGGTAAGDEYFTVVQRDQRNAGKTYVASGPNDPALLTPERYQADAIDWLVGAQRYGKHKVFVLGHSWGSMLGLRLAAAHPEWLHAYIGMGQATNSPEASAAAGSGPWPRPGRPEHAGNRLS